MSGLRRYFIGDTPLRERLEDSFRDFPGRTVSLVGQPPLGGSIVAEWDFESPESWRWDTGIVSDDLSLDAGGQMERIFSIYEAALAAAGMRVADNCVRTWIYVRDIDDNYAGMVEGRNRSFARLGLTADTHFIASTGIAGTHRDPRVLVMMDALAIPDIEPSAPHYLEAPGYLNRAIEYGVSFERGVGFDYDGLRYTLVSGTASIDDKGEILYPGDVEKQTLRALENIRVLLADDWADMGQIASALVYLRNPEDAQKVRAVIDSELPCLEYLLLHAPVCRPGWLVEIECIAVRKA
ncbi:MAG: hypothetical protein IJK90_08060 [Bacteroidales bacterium]|nr:hypothetical protein [Bacteroidales bacterium]